MTRSVEVASGERLRIRLHEGEIAALVTGPATAPEQRSLFEDGEGEG